MRAVVLFAAAAAFAAVGSAGAGASSQPHFTSRYSGTISGQYQSADGFEQTKIRAQWKITGLRVRLAKTRTFEGGWTAFYAVVAGTVTFDESESGSCTFSIHDAYPLRTALPPLSRGVPLAVDRNPLGRWTYDGDMQVKKAYKVTETCADPDGGDPSTSTRPIVPPPFFTTGEARGGPGHALHGSNTYRDSYDQVVNVTKWAWSLKPA